ncbi:MAG: BCCT family transporter [Gammaproteobacteria bacterium]|nr:BCCT family transporter [Gammaproteobacteria bacterium]
MEQSRIDWPSFGACAAIIVLVCVPLAASPDTAGSFLQNLYVDIAANFGVFYLFASVAAISFLIWLASSRFGLVRLGDTDSTPEFSQSSWIAMLFCAGVGAGLMKWCATEWAYYFESPPFGVAAHSVEASEWASTYGLFHWGITAWAFYCLPAIAIAYPYYRRQLNVLRFSLSCNWFLRGNEHGPVARIIDFLFMIALIGGAAASLGFSTPLIAACVAWMFGTTTSFALEVTIMGVCVALFVISVWLGLKKGIKRLSDINMYLAFGLLLFILVVGPTLFLLKTSLNSVGMMTQNFLRMSFWTEPFTNSGFVESWTVFYWAWWIAFAPYVGLFITRISRGRTIRQVITGMLIFGSLGSWVFYMIIGNYALSLQLTDALDFVTIMNSSGDNAAIVATLASLPLAPLVVGVFALVSIVFAATTYDSASYSLASGATLHLSAGDDPARWHRVFWAFALAVMPIALLFISDDSGQGLKTMQALLLVVSLPILLVGVVMSVSLVKSLRADHPL